MSNDKLREAAEDVIAWFSKRAVAGWAESEDGLRINTLRAALADSADDGGVLGARTIERSVEPDTHGEASIDREVRPLSAGAPPESNAALMREAARDLDWMASRAAGHAKRLHISVSLCEAAARIEAALADSADAPSRIVCKSMPQHGFEQDPFEFEIDGESYTIASVGLPAKTVSILCRIAHACGSADTPPKVTAIREGLCRRLINTGRLTGADRGIVMDYFDRAALAAAQKEGK